MPKRFKLIAGISADQSRGPSVNRQAKEIIETTIRQLTFEDGIEVSTTVWHDGTVVIHVKRMNSGEVLHEWRKPRDGSD